jgi:beta-glucosidase
MEIDSLSVHRRDILAATAGLAAFAAAQGAHAAIAQPAGRKAFPKGFRWGVSTAGHQIEGNNVNSDLWVLENVKPTAFAERSGDACDSYHRYEEDIALLAGFGFNTYRFSLEWARIEPSPGQFSQAELDYYRRVIATCHRHGVAPAVTFLHVSAPRWFAEASGWLNPDAPKLFARFCSVAARALGDGMGYAFTINEPQVARTFRVVPGAASYFKKHDDLELAAQAAAAKASGADRFITMNYPDIEAMMPQLIAGHEQGFAAIKAERSTLLTSVTINYIDFQPATDDSPYESIRKAAYGDWLDVTRRAADFAAIQVYRQVRLPGKGKPLPAPPPLPFVKPNDMMGQMWQPDAPANVAAYVYGEVKKPIFITENGLDTADDARRIWQIDATLSALHATMQRGVPVMGYLHWSLLDNFEWEQGYKPTYGLVAVDRTTFKRTPKPSATHLGGIARRNIA